MELTYRKEGDYYLPNLTLPIAPERIHGKYSNMRYEHIKKHRRVLYTSLKTNCKLSEYLEQVELECRKQVDLLTQQFANSEGVTEELKFKDQMSWVQMMNNCKARAEEIVFEEYIYC